MNITLPIILPLISALLVFVLGVFVYFKNRKSSVNVIFGLHALVITVWLFGTFMMFLSKDSRAMAIFWDRFIYMAVAFIPAFLYHFSVVYCGIKSQKKLVVLGYILSAAFLFLSQTDYFVKDLFEYKWGVHTKAQLFHHIFLVYFVSYVFLWFYNVFRYYRKTTNPLARQQIKYVFLAFLLLFTIGPLAYLPAYGIGIYPFAYASGVVFSIILAYAILRYRFMDIRMIFGKGAVYILSLATIIALALAMMRLGEMLSLPVRGNIVYMVILSISVLVFQAIFRFYEKIASKYFYYTFYSYQKVIADLGKKLTEILELDKLCSLIINTLVNTMKLDKTGVLLRDSKTGRYQIQRIIGFKEENGISLVKDNFLTTYLENTRKPLVYGELSLFIRDVEDKTERQQLEELKLNMEKIEANLCLPLFREDRITGMIILGSKISGEPYSEQDIDLLTILSSQASIALENAKLYAQVQDLSQNLQKKVDEQTMKIKKAYDVEKQAHTELQRLDEAKTQFIMATQHHLRTPLTTMIGYLDLMFGGTYGKISIRLDGTLKKFQVSTSRLIKVVNELLDISQFQLGKEVVALQTGTKIEPILKEIIEELGPETDTKKIYLKLIKPKRGLPLIRADSEKLKVAITNVIDNGIKYTSQGGVTISLKVVKLGAKRKLQITVEDTGMGVAKKELKTLFSRTFERGEQAKQVYTTGRGIGLYITYQIIKAHNGKIWAESEGKDKGTSFYIELPVD